MTRLRITALARNDIADALQRSRDDAGGWASERYHRLFGRALQDLQDDPARDGVRAVDEIRTGYSVYHLQSSSEAARGRPVRRPRHLLAFYIDDADDVIVARVFHERSMVTEKLD